jgi:hypothetical protein
MDWEERTWWGKMRFSIFLVLLLMTATFAQDNRSEQLDPAAKRPRQDTVASIVAGRVFAITKGGDLKPARSAQVYLFFQRGPGVSSITAAAGATPAVFYLQKQLEALQENHNSGKDAYCRNDLIAVDKAILETFEWTKSNRLSALVRFGDTDEEGYFTIAQVQPGTYDLIVRGRAGINDASWHQEVRLGAKEKLTTKVSSVESLFLSGKLAVEALAARSGSTFVSWLWRLELDGILFQNYGDIMVRLLCP